MTSINTCTQKRINKELKDFNDEKFASIYQKSANIVRFFNSLNLSTYYINDSENSLKIMISKKNNQKLLLDISVPKCYPFKPYSISDHNLKRKNNFDRSYHKNINWLNDIKSKIYDKNVLSFFFRINYQMEPKFLKLLDKDCFCCNSLTCPHNWNPSLRIDHLLFEYLEMRFIFKYNQPYNYLYLINIYNNLNQMYFDKIPDEIVDKIFNYIIVT